MSNVIYQPGMMVEITGGTDYHHFQIGEEVEIIESSTVFVYVTVRSKNSSTQTNSIEQIVLREDFVLKANNNRQAAILLTEEEPN